MTGVRMRYRSPAPEPFGGHRAAASCTFRQLSSYAQVCSMGWWSNDFVDHRDTRDGPVNACTPEGCPSLWPRLTKRRPAGSSTWSTSMSERCTAELTVPRSRILLCPTDVRQKPVHSSNRRTCSRCSRAWPWNTSRALPRSKSDYRPVVGVQPSLDGSWTPRFASFWHRKNTGVGVYAVYADSCFQHILNALTKILKIYIRCKR